MARSRLQHGWRLAAGPFVPVAGLATAGGGRAPVPACERQSATGARPDPAAAGSVVPACENADEVSRSPISAGTSSPTRHGRCRQELHAEPPPRPRSALVDPQKLVALVSLVLLPSFFPTAGGLPRLILPPTMAAPAKDPIASPQFFLGLLVQELRDPVINNNFDSQTQIASLLE
jgi:hypothetical protein